MSGDDKSYTIQLHRRRVLDTVKTLKPVTRILQMHATMASSDSSSNRHHLEVTQGAERNPVNYEHM